MVLIAAALVSRVSLFIPRARLQCLNWCSSVVMAGPSSFVSVTIAPVLYVCTVCVNVREREGDIGNSENFIINIILFEVTVARDLYGNL